jgi:hypothetical protein
MELRLLLSSPQLIEAQSVKYKTHAPVQATPSASLLTPVSSNLSHYRKLLFPKVAIVNRDSGEQNVRTIN